MKTELYKMWIKHAVRAKKYVMSSETSRKDTIEGYVSFNYKLDNIKITRPSPEYDAWCAFMCAEDPQCIVKFIVKNFNKFKDILPRTCVFLDLHQMKPADALKRCNMHFRNEFKTALASDIDEFENEKRSARSQLSEQTT